MFRKKVAGDKRKSKDRIRWRGHEVTRIEAFSDAVFAFAVTLLIVSLEVPKDYEEMMAGLRSFIPFGLCFAMLFQVWITQNVYFRRFGLHDQTTIVLNAILLFVVLFFVYPLKFLFNSMGNSHMFKDIHEIANLFLVYSAGYTCIYALFMIMYYRAWYLRDDLELTASEAFETRTNIYRNLGMTLLGVLSIVIAYYGNEYAVWAWLPYAFIGIMIALVHGRRGKIHNKLYERDVVVKGAAIDAMAKEELEQIPDDKLN